MIDVSALPRRCGECMFYLRFEAWGKKAGYCKRHAPVPMRDPMCEGMSTGLRDCLPVLPPNWTGCGDGVRGDSSWMDGE